MPQHYTPERKAEVLQQLRLNGGNVTTTHVATGIPIRTLYTWRNELWLQQLQQQHDIVLAAPPELPAFDDDIDLIRFLRNAIIAKIHEIADVIQAGALTLYRLLTLLQVQNDLTDCALKLDTFLRAHTNSEQETSTSMYYYYTPENAQ
jgi:hypothetical protein